MTDRAIIRALRIDVFVPAAVVDGHGAPARATLFARLGSSMAEPAIESAEPVRGGTRVVVIETDYALREQLGEYDAPADGAWTPDIT